MLNHLNFYLMWTLSALSVHTWLFNYSELGGPGGCSLPWQPASQRTGPLKADGGSPQNRWCLLRCIMGAVVWSKLELVLYFFGVFLLKFESFSTLVHSQMCRFMVGGWGGGWNGFSVLRTHGFVPLPPNKDVKAGRGRGNKEVFSA